MRIETHCEMPNSVLVRLVCVAFSVPHNSFSTNIENGFMANVMMYTSKLRSHGMNSPANVLPTLKLKSDLPNAVERTKMTMLFLVLLCVPSRSRLDSNTLHLPRTSKSKGQILCGHGCAKEWDHWNYNGHHQGQDIRYSHRTHVGINWCSTHFTKMERCSTRSWRYWRIMSFPVDSTQRSQPISTITSDGLTILCGPAPKAFGDLPYGLDIVRFRFKSLFCSGKTLLEVYELWKAIFDRNFHVLGHQKRNDRMTREFYWGDKNIHLAPLQKVGQTTKEVSRREYIPSGCL